MRHALVVFLLVAGWASALGSFGFHLNDEAELGAAAYNLYKGRLTVDEVPEEYYALEGGNWTSRVQMAGGHGYIAETRASAFLAGPAYLILKTASFIGSPQIVLILMATGGLFGGAYLLAPRPARWPVVMAGVAFGTANAIFARPVPDVWLPVVALQLSSILLFSAGCAALFTFVRARSADTGVAAWTLAVFVLGTSAVFWAFGQKYHAAQIGALCIVLWLRFTPEHSMRLHAAAYVVAGIAFWSHPRTGGLLVGALGLTEMILATARWKGMRPALKRAGVLGLALAVGITPYVIENSLVFDQPVYPGYAVTVARPAPGAGGPSAELGEPLEGEPAFSTPSFSSFLRRIFVDATILSDLREVPATMLAAWLYPAAVTESVHVQLGVLMVAPLLVLAPLGIFLRRRSLDVTDLILMIHFLAILFVYGLFAARPAKGAYDSRYLSVLLVGLAVWAAPVIAHITRGQTKRVGVAVAAVCGVLLLTIGLALSTAPHDYTLQFHVIRTLGLVAVATSASWAVARLLAPSVSWMATVDAPVIGFALLPPLLFVLQLIVHHPPRQIVIDPTPLAHFLPLAEWLSVALDRAWGS